MAELTRRNALKAFAAASAAAAGTVALPAQARDTAASLPKKWDMTTDVLVAGSGIAGMSAAIAAIDNGAKVLVFEKGENYGGCARINGGIIALRNDTPDALYAHLTNPQNVEYRKNDPALVKKYAQMCWPTKAWLEAHGVKFLSTSTAAGKYDSQHHETYLHIYSDGMDADIGPIHPQASGGYRTDRGIMMPFKDYFEGKGGKIFLNHKVVDLYKDAKGRVVGARVESAKGSINLTTPDG